METKIKDITGAEITVTDLKEAVRQCRECLKSLPDALGAYRGGKPCLHVAATARPAKAETGTRQATAVKIRREKNRTTTVRFFCFPSIDRRMVAQLPVQFTPDMSGNATGRNFRD